MLIPNSFQTPNLYIDRLMPMLTGEELRVLLYAARRIFGFQKRQDRISIRQFSEGTLGPLGNKMDCGTGLQPNTIKRAIRGLEEFHILVRTQANDPHANEGAEYELQLDSDAIDWVGLYARLAGWEEANRKRTARATEARGGVVARPGVVAQPEGSSDVMGGGVVARPGVWGEGGLSSPGKLLETQIETQRARTRDDHAELCDRILAAYPKRAGGSGKKQGREKILRLLKAGEEGDAMLEGVKRYAVHCDSSGKTGTEYVKQIPTFLNGRFWEEEFDPVVTSNGKVHPDSKPIFYLAERPGEFRRVQERGSVESILETGGPVTKDEMAFLRELGRA